MKIKQIETIPIRIPLKTVYSGSNYSMSNRCTIITRVYTTDGIIGECYNGDEDDTLVTIKQIVDNEIAPKLLGEDVFNTERCSDIAREATRNSLRDRKLATQAQACVDSAIHDAVGKALRTPLFRMWGGHRSELPVTCVAGYHVKDQSAKSIGDEIEQLRAKGFAGCKFKVGRLTPEADIKRLEVVSMAAGSDFIITVDANQNWSAREAVRFGLLAQKKNINLFWFEEPCKWESDKSGMELVRKATGIPVAAGQSEISAGGCRDLMMSQSIDYCNFDASWGGGPTEWKRVAGMARCFDVCMAHHEEAQISAHLLGSISHGSFVELFHPDRDPIFYCLFENHPQVENGKYRIPDGDGWGLSLDKAVIAKYRTDK
jgi:D-galactarolactone cycloisomerase